MKAGDIVTLLMRDSTGAIVSADFVKIVKLFTSCALVHYVGGEDNRFSVMRFNLR